MNKSKEFTNQENGGSARLVDLCAEDRGRVAALVDELGRHAERTCTAEARIARLNEQLECQARDAEDARKQMEEKQAKETAALETQLAVGTQAVVELQARLATATQSLAETQARLEAESRASAENAVRAKQAEQKFADLRRNATKVAELNRALESRLAALETKNAAHQHAATQTEAPHQIVPRALVRAPTQIASRESAVLSELFFTTSSSPPELEDLFFLPSAVSTDDGLALFNT